MKKSMGTKQALKLNFAVFFFSIAEAPGDPAAGAVAVGGERRPPRGQIPDSNPMPIFGRS